MPEAVKSFGNWLKEWQAIVAVVLGVFSLGVGWQVVKGDTTAMRERIARVEVLVESNSARNLVDRELLIRIDTNLSSMNERLKRIEAKQ